MRRILLLMILHIGCLYHNCFAHVESDVGYIDLLDSHIRGKQPIEILADYPADSIINQKLAALSSDSQTSKNNTLLPHEPKNSSVALDSKLNTTSDSMLNIDWEKRDTNPKTELKTYQEKLDYLQFLRYEVFSLRQQILAKSGSLESELPYGDYIFENKSARQFNALAQTYNDGSFKSGLFVGLGAGGLNIFTSGNIANANGSSEETRLVTRISPLVLSVRGGYQKFFNHYIGTRIYGGIFVPMLLFNGMSEIDLGNAANYSENNEVQSIYALGHLSVDLLFEVPLSETFRHFIGGFGGINVGIMYYRPYDRGRHPVSYIWNYNLQVDYSFNLGVSLTLFDRHRIEVGLAVPFAYLALPGFAESASNTQNADFWRSAIFSINFHYLWNFEK